MTELKEITKESVRDTLLVPFPTFILLHRGPDGDAVGSGFALKELLGQMGSPAYCLCGNEIPDRLRFLTDGQESVLEENFPKEAFENARFISVDVASPGQLGDLSDKYSEKISLMIDHHGNGNRFGGYWVVPNAAACGEMIFDLAKEWEKMGKVTITSSIASKLYGAVSSDTGCFRYSNATPATHRIAAELLTYGIDSAKVNQLLFDTHSYDELRAVAAGIQNLKTYCNGRIGIITFPYELKQSMALPDHCSELLIDYARSLRGVEIAATFKQPTEEKIFRISLRSNVDYDVSALAAIFGGGGHKRAAGCSIEAETAEAAVEKLLEQIHF